jgi:hypothetical protein
MKVHYCHNCGKYTTIDTHTALCLSCNPNSPEPVNKYERAYFRTLGILDFLIEQHIGCPTELITIRTYMTEQVSSDGKAAR